jgi:acetylornithine deacetylase/succinyl-diaminopimelate desuccinylase-like protein
MGSDTRADGLVATAECLLPLIYDLLHRDETTVALGDIEIEGEAINKIPGFTKTLLRLSDPSNHAVEVGLAMLEAAVAQQNERHLRDKDSLFAKQALSLKEISLRPEEAVFFKPEEMLPRHMAALLLADIVNEVTTKHRSENIVGTVGTYTTKFDGKLELGLDIRGIDRYSRDEAIVEIMDRIQALELAPGVWFGEPLAGSGNPVTLDKRLVGQARVAIDDFNCGSSVVMFSAAGHDAQNAARAGIPTVMLFSQSNNGGLAHHPDAYTNPDNIEKGLWALAALSMRLAA